MWDVPGPGIKSVSSALAGRLYHWATREAQGTVISKSVAWTSPISRVSSPLPRLLSQSLLCQKFQVAASHFFRFAELSCLCSPPLPSGGRNMLWVSEWSHSFVLDSSWPHWLYSSWNSPGQNTGVGSLFLLQGILPTQGSNSGLPHCRKILHQLSHKGSPRILEWVADPFSRGSSWTRIQTGVSCTAEGFFTNWATKEALYHIPIRS